MTTASPIAPGKFRMAKHCNDCIVSIVSSVGCWPLVGSSLGLEELQKAAKTVLRKACVLACWLLHACFLFITYFEILAISTQ